MSPRKIKQMVIFNSVIVVADILLFSNALLGLALFTGTALTIGAAWLALLASAAVFIKGNSMILENKETRFLMRNIASLDDCVSVFEEAIHHGDVFDDNILRNIDQIKRFRRKQATIKDILLQKFSADELSFQKFVGVLLEVEEVIYMNIRSTLNKISAFDHREYEALRRGGVVNNAELSREKMGIYNEYINFVRSATETNENILLKMDKMLLEISRYNSIEDGDVQRLPAIVEMDDLIKHAGLYK